jgi:hypothetical protein
MFFEHARPILHRHFVAGESDHSCAQRGVLRMQGHLFERGFRCHH